MRWEKSGVGRFATARYSTVDAAFPRTCGLLAYTSTPRTPQARESHRLNGTLTPLTSERTARRFKVVFVEKLGWLF